MLSRLQRIVSRGAALAVALLVFGAQHALACPSCGQALESQNNGNLVAGYQWSILFMMGMPFTLFSLFSAYMYWEICRARAAQAAAKTTTNSPSVPASNSIVRTTS